MTNTTMGLEKIEEEILAFDGVFCMALKCRIGAILDVSH
jgi:hypothetical protein